MNIPEISCKNCPSACCGKGQNLTLSDKEVQFLKEGGTLLNQKGIKFPYRRYQDWVDTKFDELGRLVMITRFMGVYSLSNRCGYVSEKGDLFECSVHDDNRRPEVCRTFEVGGEDCRYIREFGIFREKTMVERLCDSLPMLKKIINR